MRAGLGKRTRRFLQASEQRQQPSYCATMLLADSAAVLPKGRHL